MRSPQPSPSRAPGASARSPGAASRSPSAAGARRPPLPCFDPAPQPFTVAPADAPIEAKVAQELTEMQQGFRDRKAAEDARYKTATDLDYYTVIAFESGTQCDAFLAYFGIGRADGSLFVDGRKLADKLGIELPKADLRPLKKIDPRLARLVKR